MATNFGYFCTSVGLTKIVHIIFGLISMACIAATLDTGEFRERFFFGIIVTCFIISIIYLLIHLASFDIAVNDVNKAVDEVYHGIGAILLIVGASLFIEMIVKFNKEYCGGLPNEVAPNPSICGSRYQTKVSGGAFGLLNGVLYLVTVVLRSVEKSYYDFDDEEPADFTPPPRK